MAKRIQKNTDSVADQQTATEDAHEVANPAISNSSDEGDSNTRKRAKRTSLVDRLREVIELLRAIQQSGGKQTRQVQAKLSKSIDITTRAIDALSSAKIIPGKKSRSPNEYNQFVSSHMQSLKDSEMTSTEKFKHCIQLWNEHKLQLQQQHATAQDETVTV